ncbi:MAG: glycosyltransferase family 4 protein [Solirubrobacterales bacterium]|nr:glycosyltransferase family 4 protein [Solirubrobacterales bacterium]
MRVLMLHNRYRAEGGEERAVANISALLSSRGHEVQLLERSSARLPQRRAARGLLLGGVDPDEVAAAVRRSRADVVHGHNLHPLFGWRALAAARAAGARTVLHLHNFRLFCAIAVAYRDGAPCFRCRGSNTLPGVLLRCRGALGEAAVYGAGLHRQQSRLYANADRFIVLSKATGARMHELGLPAGRTGVLGNFVPAAEFASDTRAHQGSYALAVGRLVQEKGFDIAIAAARAASVPLIVSGEGPDEGRLRELARGAEVRFTGWVDHRRLSELRAGAAVVLVPSRCEEACPFAALDSLAAGVPVLVSDRGGIPERVPSGSVIAVEDREAWTRALSELWQDPGLRRRRGYGALALAREELSEDGYYNGLMALYGAG